MSMIISTMMFIFLGPAGNNVDTVTTESPPLQTIQTTVKPITKPPTESLVTELPTTTIGTLKPLKISNT